MKRLLRIGCLLALAVACSDQSPRLNISGNWAGALPDDRPMALFLQDTKGTVTGDGFIGSRDITSVQGTLDNGRFDATLITANGPIQFHSLASKESIIGDLNGSGFTGEVVILK